ncbi:MAG: protein-L-isoaspartate O-methyltransferase, partial [bacterium]
MVDFARQRQAMVDGQVRVNDVTDQRILEAMLEIPREQFV